MATPSGTKRGSRCQELRRAGTRSSARRLRAVRRIGEISLGRDKSKGGKNPASTLPHGGRVKSAVLAEAGLTTQEASRLLNMDLFRQEQEKEKQEHRRLAGLREVIKKNMAEWLKQMQKPPPRGHGDGGYPRHRGHCTGRRSVPNALPC
jgi:hypothetical protein